MTNSVGLDDVPGTVSVDADGRDRHDVLPNQVVGSLNGDGELRGLEAIGFNDVPVARMGLDTPRAAGKEVIPDFVVV